MESFSLQRIMFNGTGFIANGQQFFFSTWNVLDYIESNKISLGPLKISIVL